MKQRSGHEFALEDWFHETHERVHELTETTAMENQISKDGTESDDANGRVSPTAIAARAGGVKGVAVMRTLIALSWRSSPSMNTAKEGEEVIRALIANS